MYLMKTIQVYRRDIPVKKQEMTEHTYGITAHVVADINLTIRAEDWKTHCLRQRIWRSPNVMKKYRKLYGL